jgi:hypothetical protein
LTRTLGTGAKNPRVVFHLDGAAGGALGPRPIVATGTARPGSVVFRLGAHADDPASWCRADSAGTFRLAAPAGSRLFAADGAWPRLVPFAAGRAAPRVAFDEPVKLRIRLAQVDVADRDAELTLRFTGPESFGQGARVERVEGRSMVEFALVPADVPFEVQVHAGGRLRSFQGRTPERGSFDVDTTAIAAR